VRNTGSAVASAHPTVSPERISRVKSSASGAMVTGVFTRRSRPPSQKSRNSRRVIRSLIRSAENSASCRKRICPPHFREITHLPFASRSGHHTRYAPLPVRGSVHLSRQLLEKLTESAIIKVALREDLSEVATGCGGLRLHPAVAEGCLRWARKPEVRIHLPPA